TPTNAYAATYPLARFLYIYVNKPPSHALDPLTHEFIKLVQSKQGQEVVVKDGYFPITADLAREELGHIQ
ncbi:MAG TPA: phosphate-binding protein, partial [Gammaproteobacteria bacterium]|nr:phosphate-binding protein [Gammaproteobacteria bacterium]